MKKKIAQKLCLLLSLVILSSCFPVAAFADDAEVATPEYTVTITPETTTTAVGNTVSFTAAVQKNGVETSIEDNGRLWFFADIWQTGHEDGITGDENIKFSDSDGTSLTTEATLHTAGTYYLSLIHISEPTRL